MIVNRATSITLEHRKATISTPLSPCDFQELSLKYSLYPAFRDVVRELAGSLGLQGAATLFEGVCGRCGRCCSSLEAIADSDELFAMASHLGLSEDDFISRHTVPALTWNPGDRALARKDGACVFLTRLGQRDPGSPKYACAVHPVKPRRCAALAPALAACLKRPCDLVEHIEKIEFSGELMKVKLQGRGEYLLPLALAP